MSLYITAARLCFDTCWFNIQGSDVRRRGLRRAPRSRARIPPHPATSQRHGQHAEPGHQPPSQERGQEDSYLKGDVLMLNQAQAQGSHQTQTLAARERPRANVWCFPSWPRENTTIYLLQEASGKAQSSHTALPMAVNSPSASKDRGRAGQAHGLPACKDFKKPFMKNKISSNFILLQ